VANPVETQIRITDPQIMRALAHPARMTIMEELSTGRTGTATELAAVCDLSPSATSYHLRALAKAGLVEDAPGRGDGRERVWRSVTRGGFEVSSGPDADPETQRAEHELTSAFVDREEQRARAWLARVPHESQEWYDAAAMMGTVLLMTAGELAELNRRVNDLVAPYRRRTRRDDVPPDARSVALTYRTFPLPDSET